MRRFCGGRAAKGAASLAGGVGRGQGYPRVSAIREGGTRGTDECCFGRGLKLPGWWGFSLCLAAAD